MNSLVIFDSTYGNTEQLARTISEALRQFGHSQAVHIGQEQISALEDRHLLVLGSPTQRWHATAAVHLFLQSVPAATLKDKLVALFDTRYDQAQWLTGSAAADMAKDLKKLGLRPILSPQSFFVASREGPLLADELERAKIWAAELFEYYKEKFHLSEEEAK
jgi:flavorubredoxin